MNELIKIQEYKGQQAVSARELYNFLEVETRFDIWIKRMLEYDFDENIDFQCLNKNVHMPNGGIKTILDDYALSLDCAKEIAMLQRTPKGKQARQYFIEVEKKARALAKPLSTLDMLEMSIRQIREQENRVNAIESKVLEIEAKTITRPEYFTIVGWATLNKIQVGLQLAAKLGSKAARICKDNGYPMDEIPDPRFGKVKSYPKKVLQQVFNESTYIYK